MKQMPVCFDSLSYDFQLLVIEQFRFSHHSTFQERNCRNLLSLSPIYVNEDGLHRLDGPAIENIKLIEYWTFGQLHRTGGPALSYLAAADVHTVLYKIHGVSVYESSFRRFTRNQNPLAVSHGIIRHLLSWEGAIPKRHLVHIEKTLQAAGLPEHKIKTLLIGASLL